MSGREAAKAVAASGTRQRRSVKRLFFLKVSRSDVISREKARGHGAAAIERPVSGACYDVA
ncbi:hypothetical protein PEC302107_15720 [Pectobacterium araliae]|uniref:Uncharacterized protein n=1 Tax=Pectobacterium araliae TaxID=3073862 RepID=A0AAN0KBF7_9GAMM|nr:hypothetical protein PEC302110_25810 [Pectobacterium sp. MAFF 302110]GKW19843.1 hypothetical protein PEC302107_15720 [Pectobacterium carotovorum subsp. carotovorum]